MIRRILPYAAAQFCTVAMQWLTLLYVPLALDSAGVEAARLGGLISVFSLATLTLVLPLGILADRLPPRPMLLVGGLVAAAANLWLTQARSYWGLLLGMYADGAGFTLASIALYSLFFKQVAEERRGREIALFAIGGNLGAGAGAWACGELVQAQGYDWLFVLAAAFALAWALIALAMPRTRGIAFPILEYGRDLRRARAWVLIAIFFVTASHAGFEQAGYGLLQRDVLHLSDRAIGGLFMALGVWMALVSAVSGRLSERLRRPVLATGAGLVLSGIFMAASGSAVGAADFLLYRILHTAGDSVWSLFSLMLASMIFPRKRAGGAFAFAITVNTAAYFVFANAGGVIGGRWGFGTAFHLSGLIEVLGGLTLLVGLGRLERMFAIDG